MIQFIVRELRSLRFRFVVIVGAIALGVAAITAVHSIADAVREGIERQARPLMAGDVVVRSMHPFPEDFVQLDPDHQSRTKEMLSMVTTSQGNSVLVEVKAVSERYPLYGDLVVAPQEATPSSMTSDQVLVQSSLLHRMDIEVGQNILLNGASFQIVGVVQSEPDRLNVGLNSGPRVLLSLAGLERSGIEQFGSRIARRIQWKTSSKEDKQRLLQTLRELQEAHPLVQIQGNRAAQPSTERSLDNTETFLSLVALLSLLIGLIGVVQSIQSWLQQRLGAIATYRCLGMTNRELLVLYTVSIGCIALLGSLTGIGLSYVAMHWIFGSLEAYLPIAIAPTLSFWRIAEALLLGVGMSLLSSLPILFNSLRVSPLAALRVDVQPPATSVGRQVAWLLWGVVLLTGLAIWQSASAQIGGWFVGGVVVVVLLLALSTKLLSVALGGVPIRSWVVRQSLANIRRPGFGMSTATISLGVGMMVVIVISLIQTQLNRRLEDIPLHKAPTNFMIDIQSDQWSDVESYAREHSAQDLQSAPVIMGRIAAINGQPVSAIVAEKEEAQRWAFTREQRLTYDQDISPDSIIEGSFGTLPANNELCLEERYAERLGVQVGDSITFEVQGIPIAFQVTATRRVKWESFNINFFIVGERELLQDAPQFRLAAARLGETQESDLQDVLVKTHPNVTVVSIREIVRKLSEVFENLSLAIQSIGYFSMAAGFVILIGALQTTAVRREKQIQLLFTLGATTKEIRWMFVSEFAILGLVATLVGGCAAWILSWGMLTYGFRIDVLPSWGPLLLWIVAGTVMTTVAGLLVTYGQIRTIVK